MSSRHLPLILASSSPQRVRLLEQSGVLPAVAPVNMDEDHLLGDSAMELVQILALDKLKTRLRTPFDSAVELPRDAAHPASCTILAADTIVAMDEHRLGKPADANEARTFLRKLSGRTHEVLTAQALYLPSSLETDIDAMTRDGLPGLTSFPASALDDDIPGEFRDGGWIVTSTSVTHISLISLEDREIEEYLRWNEWQGAAGGYRVQGRAGCFLREMKGSFTNVVGLPIEALYGILRRTSFWQYDLVR